MASLGRFFAWYNRMLNLRPMITTACTTGVIASCGDIIAQEIIERKGWEGYNFVRTLKLGCIGLLFTGPVLRIWYVTLDRIVRVTHPGKAAVLKMGVDQTCFAPLINGAFLSLYALTQGSGLEGMKEKLKKEYKNVMIGNWKLWPAAQIINFYFVPLNMRVNYVNVIAVAWNSYLAWLANR